MPSLGDVANIGASVANMATTVLARVLSLIESGARLIWSSFNTLARFIGGVVIGAFAALVAGLTAATKAATEAGRNLVALRNATNLPASQAFGMQQRFGAFGVGGDQLSQMFGGAGQNPMMFRMKAALFGLPGYQSEGFIPALAERYQGMARGGPMGFMMAQNMMSTLGINNPQMLGLANLPQRAIREQMGFQERVQSRIGLDPEAMRRMGEELPLIMARIGLVIDGLKVRLGQELLPLLENGIGALADYLADKIPTIVEYIQRGAEWLWSDFPVLVVQALQRILEGGARFLDGAQVVVGAVGEWIASFMDATAGALSEMGNNTGPLHDILSVLAQAIDFTSVGFRGLAQVIAPLGAILYDVASVASEIAALIPNTLLGLMDKVGKMIGPWSAFIPGVAPIAKYIQEGVDAVHGLRVPTMQSMFGEMLLDPFRASREASALGTTDMVGKLLNFENSGTPGRWSESVRRGAANMRGWTGTAVGALGEGSDWLTRQSETVKGFEASLGKPDERRSEWRELIAASKRTADNTGRLANRPSDTDRLAAAMRAAMERVIARATAEYAEDEIMWTMRGAAS